MTWKSSSKWTLEAQLAESKVPIERSEKAKELRKENEYLRAQLVQERQKVFDVSERKIKQIQSLREEFEAKEAKRDADRYA